MIMHNDLQAVLNNVLDLSKQLILCLDRENACLITRKYDQLVDNARQKQQLVDELDALDLRRQAIADGRPFERLIADSTTLDKLWTAIQSNIQICAEKNEVNGRLLHRQSRLTRETMEILTGRNLSTEKTYDASGHTSAQGSLLPNIEV